MGHTYANLVHHVVFSTKERRPCIHNSFRDRLHQYMGGIARQEFRGALSVGGTADHVHGLLVLPPTCSVSDALRQWKTLSSKWVHETFPSEKDFGWQEGYGVFSVSQSMVLSVATYIETQMEHHKKMTFEDEFVGLLKRHGIEYDPKYVYG